MGSGGGGGERMVPEGFHIQSHPRKILTFVLLLFRSTVGAVIYGITRKNSHDQPSKLTVYFITGIVFFPLKYQLCMLTG